MIPLIFFWCICYPKLVGAQTLGPLPRAAPRDNWTFWLCTICCFLWYLVEPRSASKGILCWFGLFWLLFFGGNPANPPMELLTDASAGAASAYAPDLFRPPAGNWWHPAVGDFSLEFSAYRAFRAYRAYSLNGQWPNSKGSRSTDLH